MFCPLLFVLISPRLCWITCDWDKLASCYTHVLFFLHFGLPCNCAIPVFLRKYHFLRLFFPLGIFSLGSVSLLNFIESRVHDLYFTVIPHSLHENEEHTYFIVSATFPPCNLSQLLPTACNQWKVSSLLAVFWINTSPTPSKSLLDNLFWFLPNICADGKVSIISKSGALADSASCSQTALSAWSTLFRVPVTPPLCISLFIVIHMLMLWYHGLSHSQLCKFSCNWVIVFKIPSISCSCVSCINIQISEMFRELTHCPSHPPYDPYEHKAKIPLPFCGLNICPVICRTVFQCSENPSPSAATIYAGKCSFPRCVSHFLALNSWLEEEKRVQAEFPAASRLLFAPCSCFWSIQAHS